MDRHILPVPLDKAYRLLNHGPTVLVNIAGGHFYAIGEPTRAGEA